MHVLAINCTLKPTPDVSNTDALLDKIDALFQEQGVTCERIRFIDHAVKPGIVFDAGSGDAWPSIFARIKQADIVVVATPIWMGHRASTTQLLMERLDGSSSKTNDLGQYPLYNKVGACVVTGNEDGAHACAEATLFNLTHFGATIPPNADCYWVGDAGPGNSYREAHAQHSSYVNRTARMLVANTTAMARLLSEHPIQTDINAIEEAAESESDGDFEIRYTAPGPAR